MIGAGEERCLLNLLRQKKFVTRKDADKLRILSFNHILSSLISAGFKIKQHNINGVNAYELRK